MPVVNVADDLNRSSESAKYAQILNMDCLKFCRESRLFQDSHLAEQGFHLDVAAVRDSGGDVFVKANEHG